MVSSSFQTENCWTYFGRHPINQVPYRWRLSALLWYLAVGLITGALRVPIGSLGAFLILWASCGIATIRRGEVDSARTTCPARARARAFVGSRIEPGAALHETLVAIVNQ